MSFWKRRIATVLFGLCPCVYIYAPGEDDLRINSGNHIQQLLFPLKPRTSATEQGIPSLEPVDLPDSPKSSESEAFTVERSPISSLDSLPNILIEGVMARAMHAEVLSDQSPRTISATSTPIHSVCSDFSQDRFAEPLMIKAALSHQPHEPILPPAAYFMLIESYIEDNYSFPEYSFSLLTI